MGPGMQQPIYDACSEKFLAWVEARFGQGRVASFDLHDSRNAACLVGPDTDRNAPFTAYQVTCDVLRVGLYFCLIVVPQSHC